MKLGRINNDSKYSYVLVLFLTIQYACSSFVDCAGKPETSCKLLGCKALYASSYTFDYFNSCVDEKKVFFSCVNEPEGNLVDIGPGQYQYLIDDSCVTSNNVINEQQRDINTYKYQCLSCVTCSFGENIFSGPMCVHPCIGSFYKPYQCTNIGCNSTVVPLNIYHGTCDEKRRNGMYQPRSSVNKKNCSRLTIQECIATKNCRLSWGYRYRQDDTCPLPHEIFTIEPIACTAKPLAAIPVVIADKESNCWLVDANRVPQDDRFITDHDDPIVQQCKMILGIDEKNPYPELHGRKHCTPREDTVLQQRL